jgi:hypothetical protein
MHGKHSIKFVLCCFPGDSPSKFCTHPQAFHRVYFNIILISAARCFTSHQQAFPLLWYLMILSRDFSLFSCGNTDRVTTGYRVSLSISPRVLHRLIELVARDADGIMPGYGLCVGTKAWEVTLEWGRCCTRVGWNVRRMARSKKRRRKLCNETGEVHTKLEGLTHTEV